MKLDARANYFSQYLQALRDLRGLLQLHNLLGGLEQRNMNLGDDVGKFAPFFDGL